MADGIFIVLRYVFFCVQAQEDCTALIIAAHRGHTDSIRLLLDAGADKEAKDNVRAL